uniref:Complement factor properdin n=2 Tax=Callorhinchus milii TaxID=7868 RepID=V9KUM3_CALMI
MASVALLVLLGCVLLFVSTSVAEMVYCYQEIDPMTGHCKNLIGKDIERSDCCMNMNYSVKLNPEDTCKSCRASLRYSVWGEWSPWSGCTVSCKEGVQQRRRLCLGQRACRGEKLEARSCTDQACCPGGGGWAEWAGWSRCSVTCSSGTRERVRVCGNPTPTCGGVCVGNSRHSERCDTQQVCPTHGAWGSWGSWANCGGSCQTPRNVPVRSRFRQCNSPAPSSAPPGHPCPGVSSEPSSCSFLPPCPVDGGWGSWSPYSQCPVTCGMGLASRHRACNHPAPVHGGRACEGQGTSEKPCNTGVPCEVDGVWSEWRSWTVCEHPVNHNRVIHCKERSGRQSRRRDCMGLEMGAEPCEGGTGYMTRACYNVDGCVYNDKGNWTQWSQWGLCHPPCGPDSRRSRERICEPQHPPYRLMDGYQVKNILHFWGDPIFECDEISGEKHLLKESLPCHNVPDCD